MTTFDASTARCQVLTYKEGLLSAVAHDLKLAASRFTLEVDEAERSIRATFDAASLHVLCAVKNGLDAPSALSSKDKRDIEQNILKDVLLTRKHPEVRFTSTLVEPAGEGYRVKGKLELNGTSRDLDFAVQSVGDDWMCEIPLHQPHFGIKPFSAMLGTLKIKPDITVRVSLPKSRLAR
jgi:hypothetical protein